ncbi:cytochrome P450 [Artomyces pyxidatus]|uniref:Cytochrome P450 n=1 Tax=Artomyces pyxidatus TaxID=48021 RepID=A0ACB8SXH2_9AGAM|nr:cytochrome P450 [Artomyces pyxidatus]
MYLIVGSAVLAILLLTPSIRDLILRLVLPYFSPLRDLQGPTAPSWLYGNVKELQRSEASALQDKWIAEYGHIFKFKGFFGTDRVFALDTRAVGYVLSHAVEYQKPEQVRYNLGQVLGHGLLFVEGDKHKQQRRIMSPAFGPTQIRALTSIFVEKSNQLRDIWMGLATQTQGEEATVDVLAWLNKMTLDVIGLAGFNYSFDALNAEEKPNELNEAVRTVFSSGGGNILQALQSILPFLRIIPTERQKRLAHAQATMNRIGMSLLESRKAALREAVDATDGAPHVGRKDIQGKDLLSLLIKANMAEDIKEDGRMSDQDVLAQVPTFLIAGHETTSSAVTWALYGLSLDQRVQDKLRAELRETSPEDVTMEFLSSLPYLDAVVRETMRLYSPVPGTVRIACKDDVIPTAKEWTDRHGVRRNGIPVKKGDPVFIPIKALNRWEEIWGTDAAEFKPERWEDMPEAAHAIPGIWGNSLAFSGGTRACIGYRFSVIEMKALVYTLVRTFRFTTSFDPARLRLRNMIVTRPYLEGKEEDGPQMPLYVSVVAED